MEKKLLAVLLAALLLLSLPACGADAAQPPEVQQPAVPTQQTAPSASPSAPTQTVPKAELPELLDTIGDALTLTPQQSDAFCAFLAAQQPEYEFFGLYDLDAVLTCWEQLSAYTPAASGILQNGSLDRAALLQRVQENNAQFLAATGKPHYAALSDHDFSRVFSIVCTGIEELLTMGVDEALLDEKLGDLKILSVSMAANGIMTHQDTVLAISETSAAGLRSSDGADEDFRGTVLHEVMHLGQIGSDAERVRQGIAVRVGPCIQWDDLTPQPLFWEWYVEGSAEHLKMDILVESTPSVYEPYVRALDTMALALLPTHDPTVICRQSLSTDLSRFFALFGADTAEEQREILRMMCAFDVALARPEDFDAAYKARYGAPLADRLNYNDRLIGAACLSLAKVFYRQLCEIAAEESSLAELFSLITAYEIQLSRATRYQNNTERNRPFIDGYTAMQAAFFEQLAACTGMTAEDMRGQYLAWYYGENAAAINAPHLDTVRQSWLREQMERHAEQFPKQKAICEFAQ